MTKSSVRLEPVIGQSERQGLTVLYKPLGHKQEQEGDKGGGALSPSKKIQN